VEHKAVKEKLLVVDDEPAVRKLIRRVLHPIGYDLIEASDGDQAAELVRREHPSLVLLDMHMPKLDGIAALDEILKIDSTLAVIMITGDRDADQAALAMKRGACDCITKPFEPRCLETSVAANLNRYSSSPPAGDRPSKGDDDKVAEVGLLSPVIAHDLNNALCVVLAMADIVLKDETLSPETRGDLNDVRKAAARGKIILDNFAGLAKTRRLALAPCDLHALARSVLSSIHNAFNGSAIKLNLDLGREAPIVMASRAYLRRLLLDLIAIAMDAMKGGGSLAVKTELVGRPGYKMPLVRVTVEDSGPGIPIEILTRMRRPLAEAGEFQDDPGIRLYICSAIALQHRGRLCVENKPEGGARVILYLPVSRLKNSLESSHEWTQERRL
jgi:two-component system, NtrC family, sensor histidine kinase HydH